MRLFEPEFLTLPHPLTNFETGKYYQIQLRFNGVYSTNNLPEIMDDGYIINIYEWKSIGIHWLALSVNGNNVTYCGSIVVEYISKEIKQFIENKNIMINIYEILAYESIMWRYFWTGFIHSMLDNKKLIDFTNFFSRKSFKQNENNVRTFSIT